MGSQLYSADAIARLTTQSLSRASARTDKSAGGFDSLLQEARSARETSRRKLNQSKPQPAKEAAPAEQPVKEEQPSPAATDVDAGQAQADGDATPATATTTATQSSTTSEQTPQGEQQASTTPEETQSAAPVVSVEVVKTTEAIGDLPESPAPATTGQIQLETEGLESNPKPSVPVATMAVPLEGDEIAEQSATVSAGSVLPVKKSGNSAESNITPATSESSDESKPVAPQPEPTPVTRTSENRDESSDSSSAEESAKKGVRMPVRREALQQLKDEAADETKPSLLELKVKDAKESETSASKSASVRPATERSRTAARALDVVEPAKVLGAQVTSGDNTAAAIARFLVSAPADTASAAANVSTNAGQSQAATAPVATAARVDATAAGPSTTVMSGVLTAESTASATLDATARVLSASNGDGRYHVTMQLDPPDLGQLRLQIRMEQHAMTLQVDADTSASAKLIESRLSDLRDALASHGIRLDRSDVVVRSPSSAGANPQNQDGGQNGTGQQGRGAADGSGGWLSDGRQASSWQEQGSPDQGSARDYEALMDTDAGAATVDADRAGFGVRSTTELSLDLVA